MKLNTKYGEVELIATKIYDTFGNETDATDIYLNAERISTFRKVGISFFEGLSGDNLTVWTWNIEERIEDFNEKKREAMEREDCIQALWSACRKHGMGVIYRFICSLHSTEGAAQQNIYDYLRQLD